MAPNNNDTGVSRYASLGLNRRPLYFTRRVIPVEETIPLQTTYQRNWAKDDKTGLDGLEDVMPLCGVSVREYHSDWQPINRINVSRFTTGLLTTSGWQPVNNTSWNREREQVHLRNQVQAKTSECGDDGVVKVDQGRQHDNSERATSTRLFDEQMMDWISEIQNDDSTSCLEDMYFDHDGSLKYLQACSPQNKHGKQHRVVPKEVKKKSGTGVQHTAVKPSPTFQRSIHSGSRSCCISPSGRGAITANMSGNAEETAFSPYKKVSSLDCAEDVSLPYSLCTFRFKLQAGNAPSLETEEHAHSSTSSPTPSSQLGTWELAFGTTTPVRIGISEPDKLTVRLSHTQTRAIKTPTYPEEDIDWHSNTAIYALNQWRAQVLHAHNLTPKWIRIPYSPEQEAWLVLLHQKVKAAAEDCVVVRIPGAAAVMRAMNAFFADKIFMDENGRALPQRELRDEMSVRCKLQRKNTRIWTLRTITRNLLKGKRTREAYVPHIGDGELIQFMRDELENTVSGSSDVGSSERQGGIGKTGYEALAEEEDKENFEGYG